MAAATADMTLAGTSPGRWHDLAVRLRSAALLIPPALLAIWAGGLAWAGLVVAGAGLLVWEWARMCRGQAGPVVAGTAVIGLGAAALVGLRADPVAGVANLLFLCALVWASDSVAYLVGRRFGGPRLAPHASPAKTWAGATAGLAAAMAAGGVAAYALTGPSAAAVVVAGGLGLVAQAGDLLESWVKRRCAVKDSSGLIPGHGGLLDRLDALLAAAVVAMVLAAAQGPGVTLWGVAPA